GATSGGSRGLLAHGAQQRARHLSQLVRAPRATTLPRGAARPRRLTGRRRGRRVVADAERSPSAPGGWHLRALPGVLRRARAPGARRTGGGRRARGRLELAAVGGGGR